MPVATDNSSSKMTTKRNVKAKQTAPSTSKKSFFKQGTTWAGIMTIGAAIATGGLGALADPAVLPQIGIGLSLLFAEN